jgi:hypothetical protein
MKSIYIKTDITVQMPEFKGRLLYMHKTSIIDPILPIEFQDYTEQVRKCLSEFKGNVDICYITIDEKTVCNETHRRAGRHVDYNWYENLVSHGGTGNPAHSPIPPAHQPKPTPPPHSSHGIASGGHRLENLDETNGGILLVSNHVGCKVFKGDFTGSIGEKGDCSRIDVKGLQSEVMEPGKVYFLNALCIHEPLVIKEKVERSLIRINFHPDYKLITNANI